MSNYFTRKIKGYLGKYDIGYKYWIKIDERSWMSELADCKMASTVFKGGNFYDRIFSDFTKEKKMQPSVTLVS